jgi:ribosomal protein S18 acetylase RimI-like enzyme
MYPHFHPDLNMTPDAQAQFPPKPYTLKNGATVLVRPMALTDAQPLGDFYVAVPRKDWRFYCPYKLDHPTAAQHAAEADKPNWVVLVIQTPDNKIAGYAWYRWDNDQSPESTFGICIHPDWQGTGAGRAVIARLLEVARVVGPPVMNLTVQLANPSACALYQKMGFKIIREQTRGPVAEFPAEPEYFMRQPVR